MMQNRTHTCGELRLSDAGKSVQICGWLENVREVGAELAFAVVRDFYGTTQVVAETPEMVNTFKSITKESTISVAGTVRERASKSAKMATGEIEIVPEKIEVLGRLPDQPQPGGRRGPAAQVPLSGPAQPRGEEQHRPALQRGGRPAPGHDRPRLPGDHHPHPHRFLPRGRPGLSGARPEPPRQVLCPAPGAPAVQAAADDLRLRPLFPDRPLLPG